MIPRKSVDISEGILAIDIGSGTQDILVWRPGMPVENCPKLVLPSATTIIGEKIKEATSKGRALFLSGTTMGGGPSAAAIRRHLKTGLDVFSLPMPALTFNDNIEKVSGMGIKIVDKKPEFPSLVEVNMEDIDLSSLKDALGLFHVNMPGLVVIAVQDHGYSPQKSNRTFRFGLWKSWLESGSGCLENLLYEEPPDYLTRMCAVHETASGAWVMDTGACAILGSLNDRWVAQRASEGITIVNAGNEHTLAALVKDEKVWGIYEHHTSLVDSEKLGNHLSRFRQGVLSNREIFEEMGHGCFVLPGVKEVSSFPHLSLTGPNREKFRSLGGYMAAPFGDMMLTGCFGLVEAVKRKLNVHGR